MSIPQKNVTLIVSLVLLLMTTGFLNLSAAEPFQPYNPEQPSSAHLYHVGDVVTYDNQTYKCVENAYNYETPKEYGKTIWEPLGKGNQPAQKKQPVVKPTHKAQHKVVPTPHQKTTPTTGSYQLGCWIDEGWSEPPFISSYNIVNLGMIAALDGLYTGNQAGITERKTQHSGYSKDVSLLTYQEKNWNTGGTDTVKTKPSYLTDTQTVLFTYGSSSASVTTQYPSSYPTAGMVTKLVAAVSSGKWAGVDFDDEVSLRSKGMADIIESVGTSSNNGCSYTYMPWQFPQLRSTISEVNKAGCKRFILMCYGGGNTDNWSINTINSDLPGDVTEITGIVNKEKVFLAVWAAPDNSLTEEVLAAFIDQITTNKLGGLFVWTPGNLTKAQMEQINTGLNLGLDFPAYVSQLSK